MKMIVILLILVGVSFSYADDYQLFNQKLTDAQKEDAIDLEKNLMATCCFGGPVYMHGKNQKTEDAKIIIRKLLLEGKSKDDILDYFRNSIDSRTGQPYGNRILASPKASETVGKVSYWSVVGFAVLGLGILGLVIRKLLSKEGEGSTPDKLPDDVLEKIEAELSQKDDGLQ